ncbi:hypothetical protein Y032_0042g587 [Ancylostoma ceylanicum]|uniref:Uncharacterized protein n=1 Tax=Ancylostoma ceylanicum TaxID=53326 RepID=A0A016UF02_9BILA|nr:hypothetical protein Y032_0042g587 [Ancylostoma ceylanicum]
MTDIYVHPLEQSPFKVGEDGLDKDTIILESLAIVSSYPTFGYYGLADPYAHTVPFAYGAYPYGYPYALHSHYYHPRAALRNVAKSFHREDGHLSDTSMISPIAKAHKKI